MGEDILAAARLGTQPTLLGSIKKSPGPCNLGRGLALPFLFPGAFLLTLPLSSLGVFVCAAHFAQSSLPPPLLLAQFPPDRALAEMSPPREASLTSILSLKLPSIPSKQPVFLS